VADRQFDGLRRAARRQPGRAGDGPGRLHAGDAGAGSGAALVPGGLLPSRSNYFVGADSSQWHADVAQYSQMTLQNVYPNIDLALHGQGADPRAFEFDYDIHPGGLVNSIQLAAQGVTGLNLDLQGDLLLGTSGGKVVMSAPVIYQTIAGVKQSVSGQYVLGPNNTCRTCRNGGRTSA
jgi:hypothetical protein